MVGRAQEHMLPRLKRIWQTCFEEDAPSTDFVFEHLLNPDQMLVQTVDDRPVAMINWKYLRFTTPRVNVMGAYVFGVATLPEYRGRGISRTMMSGLHNILEQEGASLSCLVPASESLFDFYAGQGYETAFSYRLFRVCHTDLTKPKAVGVLSAALLDDLEQFRNRSFARSSLFGAWDRDYLRFVDMECRFYGGQVLRFSCGGRMGYAVCLIHGDTLLVREAVVERQDLPVLLAALHQRFGMRHYELRLPVDTCPDSGAVLPFAMAKWYDMEKQKQVSGHLGQAPWFAFGLD